jgi:ATP-dependent Clp protease ATP-binding subunit ClpA
MRRTFTPEAREVWRAAIGEAQRRRDGYLGTEHLLLGVLADPVGFGAEVIGTDLAHARAALHAMDLRALGGVGIDAGSELDATPSPARPRRRRTIVTNGAKVVAARAAREAAAVDERTISVRHLLIALVDAPPPDQAIELLRTLGTDLDELRRSLAPVAST